MIIGTILFAGAVAYDKGLSARELVPTEPVAVGVHFNNPNDVSGLVSDETLAGNCADVDGFIVGGNWVDARVNTVAEPGCNAISTEAGVVTPTTTTTTTTTTTVAPLFATPLRVTVHPAAGGNSCVGWVIGGTWEEPLVRIPPGQDCGASGEFPADRAQWIVVPRPDEKPAP